MEEQKHLMIVAGEVSGDMHAAHLAKELTALSPGLKLSGLGGPKMKEAGVELYEDLTRIAVVGFSEVLKHYGEFRRAFNLILSKAVETKPHAVILVDYPGFNLRLAKKLKEHNIKVFYYISPQVWAWKENRVQLIKQVIDKMLVLFKFEEDFYARHGLSVDFVGHPLLDMVKVNISRNALLQSLGLPLNKLTIGILPGSRAREIETLLPIMLKSAEILYRNDNKIQFLLVKAPSIETETFQQYIHRAAFPVRIVKSQTYDGINACDLCMVASGTATLETAILQKPMVIVYKTSFLTWLLARLFVKIPYIGLVNVVAGKKVIPECIQFDATPQKISAELRQIFLDEIKAAEIKSNLSKIRSALGLPGASHRAAAFILKAL